MGPPSALRAPSRRGRRTSESKNAAQRSGPDGRAKKAARSARSPELAELGLAWCLCAIFRFHAHDCEEGGRTSVVLPPAKVIHNFVHRPVARRQILRRPYYGKGR